MKRKRAPIDLSKAPRGLQATRESRLVEHHRLMQAADQACAEPVDFLQDRITDRVPQ
ncbi:hypothetical protein [Pseudomonas sputi]|uniref:hypothetical protein n=1 Tax=Pseudomonas sputi TaxID=2892325 RepID=UPI001F1E0F5E|nr:hypothetical protein [Pseudomonas sputi]